MLVCKKNAFIRTCWGSLEHIVTKWWISDKCLLPKIYWHRLRVGFQLPNDLVLVLTGKHFSCSKPISWETFGICLRLHFVLFRIPNEIQITMRHLTKPHPTPPGISSPRRYRPFITPAILSVVQRPPSHWHVCSKPALRTIWASCVKPTQHR